MDDFVTIDLGDDCVEKDANSPEIQRADTNNNKRNRPCSMCCRGSTAAGLCFVILTISGIISVPLLVAPLGKMTNNSDPVNPTFDMEPDTTTIILTPVTRPLSTSSDPHDVMQADNGFMGRTEKTTTVIFVKESTNKKGMDFGKIGTSLPPASPSPVKPSKPEPKNVSDDFEQLNPVRLSKSDNRPSIKILCDPASEDILKLMLGPAFNPRYMSTTRPLPDGVSSVSLGSPVGGFQSDGAVHKVRHHSNFKHKEFVVDGDFKRDLPKENVFASVSLWKQQQAKLKTQEPIRQKRSAEKFIARIRRFSGLLGEGLSVNSHQFRTPTTEAPKYPWECKSKVVWEDLGDDHFPRFIRTVQCLGNRCWFNHFQCKAKAFTVKILRRQSDQCVPVPTTGGGPTRYEQEWVYEERAVTFCCECVES